MKKPQPVTITTICSMCGLDWGAHGEDPTTEDCVRLLKAELARRPITVPMPYPQPYPVPQPQPYPRWWYGGATITGQSSISFDTPRITNTACQPIAA